MERLLAAVGDVNDRRTWSGTPYYFLRTAERRNILDRGLALDPRRLHVHRLIWNFRLMLETGKYGGYQYSPDFLERLWDGHCSQTDKALIVNCFQLFPPSIVRNRRIKKWFFVDQTLRQSFEHYGPYLKVQKSVRDSAIHDEREGYNAAEGIILHSHWAAESVIHDYGIERQRVHVVVPGANIDAEAHEEWRSRSVEKPLHDGMTKFVFVGRDWHRKGLDRLILAIDTATRSGFNCMLRVIGCVATDLPSHLRRVNNIEWLGHISKDRDSLAFLEAIGSCHVGCLLSRAEAGGISLREYHALGLPVLGSTVGGCLDHMIRDAAVAVGPEIDSHELAKLVISLNYRGEKWKRLHSSAVAHVGDVLWDNSVQQMQSFWGP